MNDLDLIAELRPEAPLPGPGQLAPARGRLAEAIAADRAGARVGPRIGPRTRRRRSWRTRPAKRVAVTTSVAAAAAAAAAALIVVPGHSPSAHPAPGGTGVRLAPATINVAAVRFLRQAAATTRRQPASAPGPDQYVYTETEYANGDKSQMWLSADGNRDGLERKPYAVLPSCTVAQAEIATEELEKNTTAHTPIPCAGDEDAGYLPSMPTDPRALLAYLTNLGLADTGAGASTSEQANDLGKAVDFLMQTTYLLPAQQAALFELMAQTPGFTVVHGARDAVGRVGVAIKWTFEGGPAEIILNPRTYAYLGDRTWPVPGFHGPDANGYDGVALVDLAFVSQAGQLP